MEWLRQNVMKLLAIQSPPSAYYAHKTFSTPYLDIPKASGVARLFDEGGEF